MSDNELRTSLIFEADDKASSIIAGIGSALLGAFAADKIAGFFTSAVEGSASFEKAMSTLESKLFDVSTQTGVSKEELEKFGAKAEELGQSNTLVTTTQAAVEGMTELAAAGMSTKEVLAAITPTIAMANGANMELADAAGIVSSSLKQFSLDASDSGRVADVLTAASNGTKSSVESLSEGMKYAGPMANAMGLSFEQATGILAKMQDAGIAASTSGTALNGVLSALADPTSTASKALDEAGIKTRDFNEVLKALGGDTPATEKAILSFGTEAGPALRALIAQGADSVIGFEDSLKKVQGTAEAAAAIMNDNMVGALDGLSGAWDSMKGALIDPLMEPLEKEIRNTSSALNEFTGSEAMKTLGQLLADAFTLGTTKAKEFLGSVNWSEFSQSVQSAFETIKTVGSTAFDALKTGAAAFGTGFDVVKAAIYTVIGVFGEFASTVTAGFGKIFEWLSKVTFGDVKNQMIDVMTSMKDQSQMFGDIADAAFKKAKDSAISVADGAQKTQTAFKDLVNPVNQVSSESEKLSQKQGELTKILTQYQEASKGATGTTSASGSALNAMGQSVLGAANELKTLANTTTDQNAKLNALIAVENAQAAVSGNVSQSAKQLGGNLTAVGDSSVKASQDIKGLGASMDASGTDAKGMASTVSSSFRSMGATTGSVTDNMVADARGNYEKIRDSGRASAGEAKIAFIAYAEKAIAANNGVANAALKVEAAQYGITFEAGESGDKIVKNAQKSVEAIGTIAKAANVTSSAVPIMGSAMEAMGEKSVDVTKRNVSIVNALNGSLSSSCMFGHLFATMPTYMPKNNNDNDKEDDDKEDDDKKDDDKEDPPPEDDDEEDEFDDDEEEENQNNKQEKVNCTGCEMESKEYKLVIDGAVLWSDEENLLYFLEALEKVGLRAV